MQPKKKRMEKYLVHLQILLGSVIRCGLIYSDYRQIIADRVEVSTLLNSWKRTTEGVALYRFGVDPYAGDVFHETPLALYFFNLLVDSSVLGLFFVLTDVLTSLILYKTAQLYMLELSDKQTKELNSYAKGTEKLLLNQNDYELAPIYVLATFLFNPYNILNCVAFTTTTFTNFCLALTFLFMIKKWRILCCSFLAITVLQSFYPIVLLVPVCLYMKGNKKISVIITGIFFTTIAGALLYICKEIAGNWSFIDSIYVTIITVTDLRPNIGLFWYFFTEMFEHFRLLFIYSFQLNATLLYLAPLSFRFYEDPMLLATSLLALTSIFKSYPGLGDVGFYMSLLPMWKHLFNSKSVVPDMQQSFVILCSLVITSVLGPTVWHLWIYSRSANANFYFGVTLAFATAQIFLVTDVLFAYIKREFTLKSGIISEEDKHKIKLTLE